LLPPPDCRVTFSIDLEIGKTGTFAQFPVATRALCTGR
jgi:hypothetical protein